MKRPIAARAPTDAQLAALEAEQLQCRKCRGYGHFAADGSPSIDKRDRKCLDCRGTGHGAPIGQAMPREHVQRQRFVQAPAWDRRRRLSRNEIADAYSQQHCCYCYRPIQPGARQLCLARTRDGEWWAVDPRDPQQGDERERFTLPIGPDCARSLPMLAFAIAPLEAETRPAPRERPLIVRAEEVRGLLGGTMTQVWRPVSVPSPMVGVKLWTPTDTMRIEHVSGDRWTILRRLYSAMPVRSPFGAPGDRLWCRETWAEGEGLLLVGPFYRADGERLREILAGGWRSPVSMPRWACRLMLEVTGLDARRVSTATDADAEAAGFRKRVLSDGHLGRCVTMPLDGFQADWSKRYPGAEWAWVATVRRV